MSIDICKVLFKLGDMNWSPISLRIVHPICGLTTPIHLSGVTTIRIIDIHTTHIINPTFKEFDDIIYLIDIESHINRRVIHSTIDHSLTNTNIIIGGFRGRE